ncbi:SmORF protein [Babesia bovis T2Bo]|uniref:SmORF n=1 Tax=Babesia bovis TaxID=5865 RepID=A7AMB5_BABBO|nr:SmORF protein [Babesia bovis T2Bo]EDO07699.1 SmORF protein [Babesia bovis T2Bo]|eukprot:XP_001611267.1 SmORF [Babesia bovis]
MVSFNTILKLGAVVAFGLSTTATSTEVAQEQPKKESFLSRFFGKRDEPTTKPEEVSKSDNVETQENTDTDDPPMFTVEWYLLPKPENRKQLRERLPPKLADAVPENCKEAIDPSVVKDIRWLLEILGKKQLSNKS